MGDKRKLQSEIDRTLKKIDEGLDVYDRIYQKVVDAESQSNKEKYEVRKPARCLTLESCPGRPRRGAVTSRDGPRPDAISGPAGRFDASPGAPRAARGSAPRRVGPAPGRAGGHLVSSPAPRPPAPRPDPGPSSTTRPLPVASQGDLKKEIKKLQRFRDQVKQWAGSNDVRDKTPLLEARKLIEGKMESFKVIEKETKTKAFSKQGLEAARERKDPKEQARDEAREWLNNSVDVLQTQIEAFEAEIESLDSSTKKSKNKSASRPARLGHLEESMSRHHQHIQRMELVLRLVDNEALQPEDVADLKDLVEDYIDRNQDDFDEFGDVEDMYADLELDDLAGSAGGITRRGRACGAGQKPGGGGRGLRGWSVGWSCRAAPPCSPQATPRSRPRLSRRRRSLRGRTAGPRRTTSLQVTRVPGSRAGRRRQEDCSPSFIQPLRPDATCSAPLGLQGLDLSRGRRGRRATAATAGPGARRGAAATAARRFRRAARPAGAAAAAIVGFGNDGGSRAVFGSPVAAGPLAGVGLLGG